MNTTPNYWLARCEADAKAEADAARALKFARLGKVLDEAWFPAGLALVLLAALAWAWSPVFTYGAVAIGYALFWSAATAAICTFCYLRGR